MPDNPQDRDPADAGGAGNGSATDRDEFAERLRALDKSLDGKVSGKMQAGDSKSDRAGMGTALRMASDFVAAVLVGAALGWGFDRLVGTAPWGMIVLLLLGFCAGVVNVMRLSGRMADPHAGRFKTGQPGERGGGRKDETGN